METYFRKQICIGCTFLVDIESSAGAQSGSNVFKWIFQVDIISTCSRYSPAERAAASPNISLSGDRRLLFCPMQLKCSADLLSTLLALSSQLFVCSSVIWKNLVTKHAYPVMGHACLCAGGHLSSEAAPDWIRPVLHQSADVCLL